MGAFDLSDFDSKDAPGSGRKMDKEFLRLLAKTRRIHRGPFGINSGYRTTAHNREAGGAEGSAHVRGKAADIAFSGDPWPLIEAGIQAGFRRIGIGRSFVHFDNDGTKPSPAIWFYPDTAERHKALRKPALALMEKAGKTKYIIIIGSAFLAALAVSAVSYHLYKNKKK